MLAVIDTNVLLVSISDRSKYHWLYKAIIDKKIHVAFTSDMLSEYEEQISSHWHPEVAANHKIPYRTFHLQTNNCIFSSQSYQE